MHCIQELDTSGARAVESFAHQGERYLVIPQLAVDIEGQPAQMTLGDSNVDALVYRWQDGAFALHQRIPVPGGEDAEFFRIGERAFLATASLRVGAGPYDLNAQSTIFELVDGRFTPFQQVPTFAAKQWKHFCIGERHFLALAQGVTIGAETAVHHAKSCIFEWDGTRFGEFQAVRSAWGYNWVFFRAGNELLLAHADHVEPSMLLRWTGQRFEDFQQLDGQSGRAFCFFEAEGEAWLAFANLHHDSLLYRWADGRFVIHQTLSGPGGREFRWIETGTGRRLVQINFLHGTREAPITQLQSFIHRFEDGRLVIAEEFATSGGTDVTSFEAEGHTHLVVANSLSEAVRFRTPTQVYRLGERPAAGA